jgi:anti-anti-sigma factor
MEIETKKLEHFTVICIQGDIKNENAITFKEKVLNMINAECRHIILNFQNVSSLNSTTLASIVAIWKKTAEEKGSLYIIANQERLSTALEITNLQTIIEVFSSEEEFSKAVLHPGDIGVHTRTRVKGKFTILDLADSMGVLLDPNMLDKLMENTLSKNTGFIALNMADIIHVNSMGIGTIIKWNKRLVKAEKFLCLYGMNKDLQYYLNLIGLEKAIRFYVSEKELE